MNKRLLIIQIIVPVLILVIAFGISTWLISNPEKAKKSKQIKTQVTIVKTALPEVGNYTIPVEALGRVIPSTQTLLKAQISGEIIAVSEEFMPGGFINKGDTVLKIEGKILLKMS